MSSDFQDQKPDFLVQTFAVSFAFDFFFAFCPIQERLLKKLS